MAKTHYENICPVTASRMTVAQKLLAGKWKFVILWMLSDGTKRFNELQKMLSNISQGILTQQLRELEKDGIIHREVYREVPPRVEYSLTRTGQSFVPILDEIIKWVKIYEEHKSTVEK